jgi:hypothetical protein
MLGIGASSGDMVVMVSSKMEKSRVAVVVQRSETRPPGLLECLGEGRLGRSRGSSFRPDLSPAFSEKIAEFPA